MALGFVTGHISSDSPPSSLVFSHSAPSREEKKKKAIFALESRNIVVGLENETI